MFYYKGKTYLCIYTDYRVRKQHDIVMIFKHIFFQVNCLIMILGTYITTLISKPSNSTFSVILIFIPTF